MSKPTNPSEGDEPSEGTEAATTTPGQPGEQHQPAYPDVHVQLTGTGGNAYAIIAAVARALRRDAGTDAAAEFTTAAFACGSYDALLCLAMATVQVH